MEQLRRHRRPEPTPEVPRQIPIARQIPIGEGAAVPEAAAPRRAPSVRIIWGLMNETLDVGNMSVDDVLQLLRRPYNIAPGVRALVNGRAADGHQQLEADDVLEFVRPAGEKGARA